MNNSNQRLAVVYGEQKRLASRLCRLLCVTDYPARWVSPSEVTESIARSARLSVLALFSKALKRAQGDAGPPLNPEKLWKLRSPKVWALDMLLAFRALQTLDTKDLELPDYNWSDYLRSRKWHERPRSYMHFLELQLEFDTQRLEAGDLDILERWIAWLTEQHI